VTLVQNISVTVAFYELVLFYIALHDHLAPYNPVPKFICIKSVLFLSFWQGVLLAALAKWHILHEVGSWTVEDVSTGVQNLLMCFEMFFAAIAHLYAFPVSEFRQSSPSSLSTTPSTTQSSSLRSRLLRNNFAVGDAVRDFNEVMPGRVVLPTGFQPGDATITERTPDTFAVLEDISDSESIGHPDEYMGSRSFAVGVSANITTEQYESLLRDVAEEEGIAGVVVGGGSSSGSSGRHARYDLDESRGGRGDERRGRRSSSSSKGKDMGGWQV
jgi:hypothetical protein